MLQRKPPKRGEKPIEHRRRLGRLRLFLDDLDDVHTLLKERTQSVSLTAGDAVADVPDDLRDATREELDEVRFVTNGPAVVVTLARDSAFARTSDDSPEALAIIDDVQALLWSRLSSFYFFSTSLLLTTAVAASFAGVLTLLLLGFAIVSDKTLEGLFLRGSPFAMFFVVGMAPLLAIVPFIADKNATRIIPQRRGTARQFTAQARHAWLIGIFGVALTALFTALITYSFAR